MNSVDADGRARRAAANLKEPPEQVRSLLVAEAGILEVRCGDTGKRKRSNMSHGALRATTQGLVLTREDGRPLRPEYATRHFKALSKTVGFPAIRLHDLRHTNASLALQAGVDMKVVSDRLGALPDVDYRGLVHARQPWPEPGRRRADRAGP